MLFRLLFIFSLTLLSTTTLAGDWYASLGYTRSVGDSLPDSPGFNIENNTKGDGWQLNGGYQYSKNFALEFGLVDYGEQVYTLSIFPSFAVPVFTNPFVLPPNSPYPSGPGFVGRAPYPVAGVVAFGSTPPYAEITTRTQGVRIMASGILPMSEMFSLSAQGGVLLSRYEMQADSYNVVGSLFGAPTYVVTSNDHTSRDAEFFAGLGLQFDINAALGVALRWERILNLGDNATLEQDLDTYNLMFIYRL